MKAFEGLLLSLVSLTWISSGQEPVSVECTHFDFIAIAKRALFYSDDLVGPDELFLGTGCQAIQVRPDELEFGYPVSHCGIITQVFFDGIVFHSWLTYRPRNLSISAVLHLECVVPSSCVSPDDSPLDDESSNLIMSPPAQYWFLEQYRYCVRCGKSHFKDNWVRIAHGPTRDALNWVLDGGKMCPEQVTTVNTFLWSIQVLQRNSVHPFICKF